MIDEPGDNEWDEDEDEEEEEDEEDEPGGVGWEEL